MKNRYTSLDHALHNESVCDFLNSDQNKEDWVITTAFYSALHFLRHKLFPLKFKYKGVKHKAKTFNHYCIIQNIQGRKHSIFKKVVREYCPKNISIDYHRMLDASYTARYNKYRFSSKVATTVRNRLANIKRYCT